MLTAGVKHVYEMKAEVIAAAGHPARLAIMVSMVARFVGG